MLPVLFKLTFDTPGMQVVMWLLAAAIAVYGAWSGWNGAVTKGEVAAGKPTGHRPYRAVVFGLFAALVALVGVAWGAPRFSESGAAAIKAAGWVLSAALVVASLVYGQRLKKQGEKDESITFAVMATAIGFAVIKFGLKDPVGRGFGAPVHTYGLMIATAFMVAIWLVTREVVRSFPGTVEVGGKVVEAGPVMREHIMNLGFFVLVSAIVGSRVLFIVVNWRDYQRDWVQVFSLGGGLVFYGGFIAAVLTSVWYCRTNNIPFLRVADAAIPSVSIGHMIGRFGCLSAGCCWGDIAKEGSAIAVRFPAARNAPFGGFGTDSLAYTDQLKDSRWADALGHIHALAVDGGTQISAYAKANGFTMPVYPTQLMESFGELCIFTLLLLLRRNKKFNGQILATYLCLYAVLRTSVEFFRGDLARGYLFRIPQDQPIILSTSQSISLGIFVAGIALMVLFRRKPATAAPAAAA